jgi:hypothetical protein
MFPALLDIDGEWHFDQVFYLNDILCVKNYRVISNIMSQIVVGVVPRRLSFTRLMI